MITVGIEPTICAPKTARLPAAIIVIISFAAKINIIFQQTDIMNEKILKSAIEPCVPASKTNC